MKIDDHEELVPHVQKVISPRQRVGTKPDRPRWTEEVTKLMHRTGQSSKDLRNVLRPKV